MSRILCLFGLHNWRLGVWNDWLGARACRRCTRFELWAFGGWLRADPQAKHGFKP